MYWLPLSLLWSASSSDAVIRIFLFHLYKYMYALMLFFFSLVVIHDSRTFPFLSYICDGLLLFFWSSFFQLVLWIFFFLFIIYGIFHRIDFPLISSPYIYHRYIAAKKKIYRNKYKWDFDLTQLFYETPDWFWRMLYSVFFSTKW